MKAKHAVCLATAVIMTASMAAVFAGCGEEKVAVKWYDGTKVLQTTKVTKGEKAEKWTPEKDGYIFVNWYSESSLSEVFDFDTKIEKDTNIFAGWRSAAVEKDMRIWYAIGEGAGTLKASSWQFATTPDKDEEDEIILDEDGYATFTPVTGKESVIFKKAEDSNTFTLELTLYGGDRFRFVTGAINDDWSGDASKAEVGIGALNGFAYAAGFNPNDKVDVTAESKEYGEVKNDAGEVVFYGGKENGHLETSYWNLWVADGMDGIYTFTMTTYPGEDANNTVVWERKGDAPVIEETHKMMFLGGHNGWNTEALDKDGNAKDEKDLLAKQSDGTFKGYVTVTKDTELKLYNTVSAAWYGDATGGNFKITEGTWCFTFNPENDEIKYEKCDYYVYGTFIDGEGNAVNYSVKEGVTPKMTTSDDGATYTVTFTATDVTSNPNFAWIKKENKPGVFAIKVVFGCSLGVKQEYTAAGGDNFYLEEGEHTVTLTTSTSKVTVS